MTQNTHILKIDLRLRGYPDQYTFDEFYATMYRHLIHQIRNCDSVAGDENLTIKSAVVNALYQTTMVDIANPTWRYGADDFRVEIDREYREDPGFRHIGGFALVIRIDW